MGTGSRYNRSMPTVLRWAGFEVMIYPIDHAPPHVHVWRAGRDAKIMLEPFLVDRTTMRRADLSQAAALVWQHRQALLERWSGIHGTSPG